MRHQCDTCGYEWLDAVPSAKCLQDRCGFCRGKVVDDVQHLPCVVGDRGIYRHHSSALAVEQAKARIASGHYQRPDVLDAVAEIIEDALRREEC